MNEADQAYQEMTRAEAGREAERIRTELEQRVDALERRVTSVNQDVEGTYRTLGRLSYLLEQVANALKGEPPEDTMWSWHDLPELARALKEGDQLEAAKIGHGAGFDAARQLFEGHQFELAGQLTANDFKEPTQTIYFEDGSQWILTHAIVRREGDVWAVYTEHMGYFAVPDGSVDYVIVEEPEGATEAP